jgi:hypothetical protein
MAVKHQFMAVKTPIYGCKNPNLQAIKGSYDLYLDVIYFFNTSVNST